MTTIAVIYGGKSTEHSISCISARAIMEHLTDYDVIGVGITRDGTWTTGDPRTMMDTLPEVTVEQEVFLHKNEIRVLATSEVLATVDVIFPVLHGVNGEDGTIQGLFELSGVPYVGNGVLASACGMDKQYTKKLCKVAGLPIGKDVVLESGEEFKPGSLTFPVYVKPARGGSSIGISRVEDESGIDSAIALARESDSKVVIEEEIKGIEVECGVLEYPDGRIEAAVPAELIGTEDGEAGFYDFSAKYLDGQVSARIPASIGDEQIAKVQEIAIATFKALNCEGLARVDFFVTENGPVINEINTLPGFTPISMYPQVFEASGVSYGDLLRILVRQALNKKK